MAVHILIVDADSGAAASSRALAQHLAPTASVVCEPTPEQAWSAAQRTPPDLLLIDPAPYGSSSLVLIQLCQESWPGMRVGILTSTPVSPSRRQQYHADVYLEKPASPARVLAALNDVLEPDARSVPDDSPSGQHQLAA